MVRTFEYGSGINLSEAQERYVEVLDEFKKVKSYYSGLRGIFKRNLKPEDNKTLTDCLGVLLPLGLEACVQEQILQGERIENTIHYQAGQLSIEILHFAAIRIVGLES